MWTSDTTSEPAGATTRSQREMMWVLVAVVGCLTGALRSLLCVWWCSGGGGSSMNDRYHGKCGFTAVPQAVRSAMHYMVHLVPFKRVLDRMPKAVILSPAITGVDAVGVDEYGFLLIGDLNVISEYWGSYTVVMD